MAEAESEDNLTVWLVADAARVLRYYSIRDDNDPERWRRLLDYFFEGHPTAKQVMDQTDVLHAADEVEGIVCSDGFGSENQYYSLFLDLPLHDELKYIYSEFFSEKDRLFWFSFVTVRRFALRTIFAWAVPTEAALQQISRFSPLIEIGAGTGYWAYLLRTRMNADVAAYDIRPLPVRIKHNRVLQTTGGTKDDQSECNVFHPLSEAWTPVLKGGPEQLLLPEHANRTLLLIWPPNENEMAHDALNAYQGRYVIYIGETLGHTADPCFPFGQTGSESFHRLLHSKFHRILCEPLPNFPGFHDKLVIYQRTRHVDIGGSLFRDFMRQEENFHWTTGLR